jgi:type II secretory pathway pseudopilin PulG
MMRRRLMAARNAHDEGFGLLEVVIALVVLAMVGAAAASMLLSSLKSTTNSRSRVAAANLALREIETVRATFLSPTLGPRSITLGEVVNPNPLPGGTAGQALTVDGRSFTVKRTAEWQSQGAAGGPCDGGASGQLDYLRVSVTVTWPDMGGTTPVTSSTLLTPPLGTYNTGTGHIKVKVLDAGNAPQEGTIVSLVNSGGGVVTTQATSTDGCAFFAFLDPASFSVQLSRAGYVDNKWQATPSQSLTVVANAVTSIGFNYAPASTVGFTMTSPLNGYAPATSTALTVYNNALTSTTHTTSYPASGPARTLQIWPYSDGVISWIGDCNDADPGSYGSYRAAPITTASGATSAATVTGVPVSITVLKGAVAQAGLTVEAVHATAGCPSTMLDPYNNATVGEVLTFPATTDAAGNTKLLLPYGAWTIKVLTKNPSGSFPTLNLSPTTATPVVQNVVVQ